MPRELTESDLLLPLERDRLRGNYKEYFKAKRRNFLATIQGFPGLLAAFQLLDEIWVQEIHDLHGLRDTKQWLPALFFIHAHLKYRVGMELAFSCCIVEAWGVLRVGIESVAYAHKIYREPHLAQTWLAKDRGKSQRKAFEKAFEKDKKDSLYPAKHGLAKLHEYWRAYSDWGGHTSVVAMATRFRQTDTAQGVGLYLDYFETKEDRIVTSIYSLLDTSWHMEHAFFDVFKTRFHLDPMLVRKRERFERKHENLARLILKKYGTTKPKK